MSTKELSEFAKILVQQVRDQALRDCDQQLASHAVSPVARRWRKSNNDPKEVIVDCVDIAIFYVLDAIDNGSLRLSYSSDEGVTIDLTREGSGELGGLYMGSGGWLNEFATERFHDDFADLA